MRNITKDTLNKLKLTKNGSYGTSGDALRHTLFDTVTLAAGTEALLFSIPQGGAKSKAKTNLLQPGKLPDSQSMLIMGLGYAFLNKGTADALVTQQNLFHVAMQGSTLEIVLAGREYDLQVPFAELLPRECASGIIAGGNNAFVASYTDTKPMAIKPNIVLEGSASFQVKLNFDGGATVQAALTTLAAASCEIQIQLYGMLTRKK